MKPHSSIQSSIFLRSIFFIGMLSISLTSYSQWFPMNPGGGGVFTSINIGPSGDIIATSDLGGAYHSKDDGISWEPIGSLDGMTMTHLQSVIFHPSNENTIFLSGDRGTGSANETGISKSINNGVTFDPVTINFAPGFNSSNAVVKSLAIAPSNPNVVYASIRSSYNKTDSRIYKSVDAGTTFNEMSDLSNTTNPAIIKLVVHPANEDVVLALSYKDRFTKDNPFQTPALPLPSYTLLLSQDGGTNWQQVILDRPSSEIYDVVFHPTAPHPVYISDAINGSLYNPDIINNSSWTTIFTTPNPDSVIWPVVGNALEVRIIDVEVSWYDAADDTAWQVYWNGSQWLNEPLAAARQWTGETVSSWEAGWSRHHAMFNPSIGRELSKTLGYDLTYTNNSRIYWVNAQFVYKGSLIENNNPALDFSPAYTNESGTNLDTWRSTGIDNITATLISPGSNANHIYLGLQDLGCQVSLDGGDHWKTCNYFLGDPNILDQPWQGIPEQGEGDISFGGNVYALLTHPSEEGKLWMSWSPSQRANQTLLYSSDFGDTWIQGTVDSNDPNYSAETTFNTPDVYGLSSDTNDLSNNTLYVTVNGDIYKTTDGLNLAGATWTAFSTPCSGGCRATAVDSVGNLYVGGEDGLFVYPENNSGWQTLMSVFSNSQDTFQHSSGWKGVTNIRPDLSTSGVVFVSVFQSAAQNADNRSGIYRCEIVGSSCTQLLGNPVINISAPFVRDVAVDPSDSNVLYATSSSAYTSGGFDAGSKGVYRSTDGGISWTVVNEGLAWSFAVPIAISPAAPDTVFIGSPGPGYHKRDFSAPVTNTIVADYQDDFTGSTPASGWSYLWNQNGSIGNEANYTPLLWSGTNYAGDSNNYPDTGGLNYGLLDSTGGHAGWGLSDGASTDRFVIATYQVAQSGTYNIINSSIDSNTGCQYSNGGELRVYVNDTLHTSFTYDKLDNSAFDTALGSLIAGQTIYVAVGPNGSDGCDDFLMDFSIEQVGGVPTTEADYQDDFTGSAPASGWSYLWNSTGVIGNAANYSSLQWSGTSYNGDSNNYPDAGGLNYGLLNSTGGHAGWGASDGASTDRFVIAAYTVNQSGIYNIIDSFIDSNTGCQYSNGGELRVYVNDSELNSFVYAKPSNTSFNMTLGSLNVGDTIYVAVGPNTTDGCDDFLLDFSVEH